MRIALVTYGDENVAEWKTVSFPLKEAYCKLHGYDFVSRHERLDDRPAGWTKIPLILERLPNYDWVYWSDADSLILQPRMELQHFIAEEKDLVFCIAGLHGTINSGEFFVRNTPWARGFLERVYAQAFLVNDGKGRPKTIRDWLKRRLCGCVGCRKFRFDQKGFVHAMGRLSPGELEEHFTLYPPGHQLYFNGYGDNYTEGCFVKHFPGSFKNLERFRADALIAEERLNALKRGDTVEW